MLHPYRDGLWSDKTLYSCWDGPWSDKTFHPYRDGLWSDKTLYSCWDEPCSASFCGRCGVFSAGRREHR